MKKKKVIKDEAYWKKELDSLPTVEEAKKRLDETREERFKRAKEYFEAFKDLEIEQESGILCGSYESLKQLEEEDDEDEKE